MLANYRKQHSQYPPIILKLVQYFFIKEMGHKDHLSLSSQIKTHSLKLKVQLLSHSYTDVYNYYSTDLTQTDDEENNHENSLRQ